ncbi:HNH endonuclease [Caulobacter phage CcrRogue]|uniref:Putative HNH homing endonuclease n=1 Tax=Caulobacter phage CcrRogue TaxID=2927986 RepID=K4JS33_9CAUD|nr:HNH endonuclease [Caulobacter phage CcrRogue]AFU86543.1 putative HNH homing endonuclease [Caulobacter phage CcrRogue]
MVEVDRAYLAGLIDGEGCISVSRTHSNASAKGCRRGYAYRSSVSVAMTNKEVLLWASETTGFGKICPKKTKPHHRPAWTWTVWSKQAAELLKALQPYLRIKAEQAKALIEFQQAMRQPGSKGLSDEEWENRERSYEAFRQMNKRGL